MEFSRVLVMGSMCLILMAIGFIITLYDFKLMNEHPEDYCDADQADMD